MPEFPPFRYTMKEVRQAGEALSQKLIWTDETAEINPTHVRHCP